MRGRLNSVSIFVQLLAWAAGLPATGADPGALEHRERREAADIATLAALTRVDHSAIFFSGRTTSGYVRDGAFHPLFLNQSKERPDVLCRGRAVSRDGFRLAYVVPSTGAARCTILIRDLRTDTDSRLVDVEESRGPLAWSWDDRELAYQRGAGLFALSIEDGRERAFARLPGASIISIDWFRQASGILANTEVCVPTGRPQGECRETGYVLDVRGGESRVVTPGLGASVSPTREEIGFVTSRDADVFDLNLRTARRVSTVPFTVPWIPVLREETWWTRVVWSPTGDRFWFGTILDEEFNSNYYLVDVRSRVRRRLLTNTSLDVTEWR